MRQKECVIEQRLYFVSKYYSVYQSGEVQVCFHAKGVETNLCTLLEICVSPIFDKCCGTHASNQVPIAFLQQILIKPATKEAT